MNSNRRQFLSGVIASTSTLAATKLSGQTPPVQPKKGSASADVCLVADSTRHWDIASIFQELGLRHRVVKPDEARGI